MCNTSVSPDNEVWEQFVRYIPQLVKISKTSRKILRAIKQNGGRIFAYELHGDFLEGTLYVNLCSLEKKGIIQWEEIYVDVNFRSSGKRFHRSYFLTPLGKVIVEHLE